MNLEDTQAQALESLNEAVRSFSTQVEERRTRGSPGKQDRPRLSVVVPCYNEQESLDELHRRLSSVCEASELPYEIVLVDDGSRDRTWEFMERLAKNNPPVVAVALARNYGHQIALSAGLTICRGERILIIDADLQDPPELLPSMLLEMDRGADVVYGQRIARKGETWFKRSSASLFYRILRRLVDIHIPMDTGDFRLVSRRALDVLLSMPEQHRFIRGMVSWIGFRQVPLLYQRDERYAGETKYPIHKMLKLAIDAITGFSIKPLRIASLLGGIFGLSAIAALMYALVSWLYFDTEQGWTSLMAVILVIGSVQLFVLGVLGEYTGRLYLESKRRPLFVIDQVYRAEQIPAGLPLSVSTET